MERINCNIYLRKVNEKQFPNIKRIVINESNNYVLKPLIPSLNQGIVSKNITEGNERTKHDPLPEGKYKIIKPKSGLKYNNNNLPSHVTTSLSYSKNGVPLLHQQFNSFGKSSNGKNLARSKDNIFLDNVEDYEIMKQKYDIFKSQLTIVKRELETINELLRAKEMEIEQLTDILSKERKINKKYNTDFQTQQEYIKGQTEQIKYLLQELNDLKSTIKELVRRNNNTLLIPSYISKEKIKDITFLLKIMLSDLSINTMTIKNNKSQSIEQLTQDFINMFNKEDHELLEKYLITVSTDNEIIRKDYLINHLDSICNDKNLRKYELNDKERQMIIDKCSMIDKDNKGCVSFDDYKSLLSDILSSDKFNQSVYDIITASQRQGLFIMNYSSLRNQPSKEHVLITQHNKDYDKLYHETSPREEYYYQEIYKEEIYLNKIYHEDRMDNQINIEVMTRVLDEDDRYIDQQKEQKEQKDIETQAEEIVNDIFNNAINLYANNHQTERHNEPVDQIIDSSELSKQFVDQMFSNVIEKYSHIES